MSLHAVLLVLALAQFRFNLVEAYSYTQIHDITISNSNGTLQCDELECPAGTEHCRVVKQSSDENLSKLRRNNTCYDEYGKVLKEKSWSEENKDKKFVNITVEMSSDGRVSSYSTVESYGGGIDDGFAEIGHSVGLVLRNVGDFIRDLLWF